jgi:hypothetical protein
MRRGRGRGVLEGEIKRSINKTEGFPRPKKKFATVVVLEITNHWKR